jgi:predicted phosphodiesterase
MARDTTLDNTTVSFLVLSDTHDATPNFQDPDEPLSRISKVDIVLHCGDLTEHGQPEDLRTALDWISNLPAKLKLVIPGNHDSCLDAKFWTSNGGSIDAHTHAKDHMSSVVMRNKGVHVLEEGTHT